MPVVVPSQPLNDQRLTAKISTNVTPLMKLDAQTRAATLGVSLSEYVRQLIATDLAG